MGDINSLLKQYILRPAKAWLQGQHIVTTNHGTYGQLAPYHTSSEPFPARQGMYPLTIFAPTIPYGPGNNSHALYGSSIKATAGAPYTAQTIHKAGQIGYGQAPTSGIYTGVEDSCG